MTLVIGLFNVNTLHALQLPMDGGERRALTTTRPTLLRVERVQWRTANIICTTSVYMCIYFTSQPTEHTFEGFIFQSKNEQ